jgi:carboxyl-terminal processing protease
MIQQAKRIGLPAAILASFASLGCEPRFEDVETGRRRVARPVQHALTTGQPAQSSPLSLSGRHRPPAHACSSLRNLEGTWLSHGYGLALEASADAFTVYDVSEHSCFVDFEGTPGGDCRRPTLPVNFGSDEEPYRVIVSAEVFGPYMVLRDSGTSRYALHRTRSLPAACAGGGTAQSDEPVENFDLFWEHMNEHYAFFALHGVDWQAAYARYRPMVDAQTSADELFEILSSMLATIPDYHLSLASPSEYYSREAPSDIVAAVPAINQHLIANYFAAPEATVTGNGQIAYRQLAGGVGYVLILGMAGYADPSVLATSEDADRSEVELAGAALDEALGALSDASSLIVDVRFNDGGMDAVSLALASRFADRKRLSYWRVARDEDRYTWPELFYVQPAGVSFGGKPVLLLTSAITVSAAETFTLAMRVLPQVQVMGERTAGSLSDVLTRQLANGWHLGLSSQRYTAADGVLYEGIGIPPDIFVSLQPSAFAAGSDAIVEAALAYLAAL